ncbi:MAG: gliding motility-associated C-terminal domain-containing protein [Flavobacteriales bacterium]|nr:gliding motility-associated C-terminal domain-containing protein [Flavobacteriales bacterium]
MIKKHFILFFLLFAGVFMVKAQSGCLSINAGNDTSMSCGINCVNLNATVVAPSSQTNTYTVSSIPYAPPVPYNVGNQMFINIDDEWSTALNLPFSFCFYGNTYNQIVVGTNGLISFDMTYAGGYCPWSFSALVPNPVLPLNAVFGVYHDIDPSICGQIRYSIQGTAPCRMAVINFNQVCHFDCNNLMSTTQIILYETTNLIDVYVQNKPTCNNWNSGNAVIGIQNATGNTGLCPPGRNTGPWSTNNEAWRFTPSGPPSYTINWYTGGNLVGTGTPITVCPQNTVTTYLAEVVYTTCTGQTVKDTDDVVVTKLSGAGVNIVPGDTVICPGQSVTFNVLVCDTGTFVWQPGGMTTPSITVSPGSTTTYVVSHTYNGQTAYDSVKVTVSTGPNITFTGNTSICPGSSTTITASGGSNLSWSPGGMTGSTVTLSPGATTTYTVTGQDQYGCTGSSTITITVFPLPNISISGPSDICFGDQVTLTAFGGQSYSWMPGGQSGGSITQSPAGTTTYTVIGTDANGCTNTATHTVNVNPFPQASFNFSPKEGCSELCVQFTNTSSISNGTIASTTWYFMPGDSLVGNNPNRCFVNSTGNVWKLQPSIKVISDKGCVAFFQTTDTLKVYPQPIADFEVSTPLPLRPNIDISFTDKSSGATEWKWTAGSQTSSEQNPKFKFEQGTYEVCLQVKNNYGCLNAVCKTIEVRSEIVIPNVFTPNGDGQNDLFVIEGLYGSDNLIFIFNRWGKKIYENANYQNEWDGTINGKIASDGTYYYIFKTFDLKEYSGSFSLFR